MRLITGFKLKKGADREEFKKFLKEKDIPAGNKIPYVKSYIQTEIMEKIGFTDDFDFVEIWEIDIDKETWEKKEWKNNPEFSWLIEIEKTAVDWVDPDSVKSFYLTDI